MVWYKTEDLLNSRIGYLFICYLNLAIRTAYRFSACSIPWPVLYSVRCKSQFAKLAYVSPAYDMHMYISTWIHTEYSLCCLLYIRLLTLHWSFRNLKAMIVFSSDPYYKQKSAEHALIYVNIISLRVLPLDGGSWISSRWVYWICVRQSDRPRTAVGNKVQSVQ